MSLTACCSYCLSARACRLEEWPLSTDRSYSRPPLLASSLLMLCAHVSNAGSCSGGVSDSGSAVRDDGQQ